MNNFRIKKSKFKLPITNYQLPITNKGLTLLEIAISMAILSITLVALANLFPIGLRASRRASNFSEASMLAQRVIDNIKKTVSIYDDDDYGDAPYYIYANGGWCSDGDGIGYFELAAKDTAPYSDEATIDPLPPTGVDNYFWRYQYPDTDMWAIVSNEAADIDNDGITDTPLIRRVYVAIYWIEGDRERADTFITYISNPFYEKYK